MTNKGFANFINLDEKELLIENCVDMKAQDRMAWRIQCGETKGCRNPMAKNIIAPLLADRLSRL
ncbi:hypothetical protein J6590_008615 [Homalodisca vitripennis]|nr:hypothetical protein J6590_008615 [Homalodisca vitripennis]